jgi:asparaginyl-tRNA synthetase
MDLAEDFLVYIIEQVLKNRQSELKVLERDISMLERIKKPLPRISYEEACDILRKKGIDVSGEDDFGAEEEALISESFDAPVFVHRYPYKIKAFYMKRDDKNPSKALCVDVLAPEGYGEIIGGGQREDDYDVLIDRIKEHKLPLEYFEWYLDLRKYGSVPHAGFGLGFERTVAWICKIHHVRETIPFARTLGRLRP